MSRRAVSPMVVVMVAAVIGLIVGFQLGYLYPQPDVRDESLRVMKEGFGAIGGELEEARSEARRRYEDLKARLSQLEKREEALREGLREFKTREEDLQARLRELVTSGQYLEAKVEWLTGTLGNLSTAEARIRQLESSLSKVERENFRLKTLLSTTNATLMSSLEELAVKKTELEGALKELKHTREESESLNRRFTSISRALLKLRNDRLLLIEVRKELPETRNDTLDYWENVKGIAARSEPYLSPMVDRVVSKVDLYFNWFERRPSPEASLEEWVAWMLDYVPSRAYEYDEAVESFRREVLLVVITHIDTAVELIYGT